MRNLLAEARVSWLKDRLASTAVVGDSAMVALHAVGVPGALLPGLVAGLVSFVAYFGPIFSVIRRLCSRRPGSRSTPCGSGSPTRPSSR